MCTIRRKVTGERGNRTANYGLEILAQSWPKLWA